MPTSTPPPRMNKAAPSPRERSPPFRAPPRAPRTRCRRVRRVCVLIESTRSRRRDCGESTERELVEVAPLSATTIKRSRMWRMSRASRNRTRAVRAYLGRARLTSLQAPRCDGRTATATMSGASSEGSSFGSADVSSSKAPPLAPQPPVSVAPPGALTKQQVCDRSTRSRPSTSLTPRVQNRRLCGREWRGVRALVARRGRGRFGTRGCSIGEARSQPAPRRPRH